MSLGRLRLLLVASSVLVSACASQPSVGGDDAAVADADPTRPDADPARPDAAPGTPDAAVDEPDAMLPPPTECGDGSGAVTVPFGSHVHGYVSGTIRPSGSQGSLDDAVKSFYGTWKSRYVKSGCAGDRYLVATGHDENHTVSEAHGYGMLIMVYMAGHDSQAKTVFDGMYRYYLAHQSSITPYLMAWAQNSSCQNVSGDNSATDGDLDIAYALLLADRQWGSGGAINYREAGERILASIRNRDVDQSGKWLLLGDWAQEGQHYNATRTSDFMPGHLASFAAVTGNGQWTALNDSLYTMIATLQNNFAGSTGLLPDFVVNPMNPSPAPSGFLEGGNDGKYAYNACRDPWRLGVHAVTKGDARAKAAVTKLTDWVKGATGGDPGAIRPGYNLNGSPSSGATYADMCFIAPFGVAAMVSSAHQGWLDSVWGYVRDFGPQGYYQDTVKLLSMITMSGNWWEPEDVECD